MSSNDPRYGSGRSSGDEWARKANGEIMTDRFGRPIRRNPAAHGGAEGASQPARTEHIGQYARADSPAEGQYGKAYMRELPADYGQVHRDGYRPADADGYRPRYDRPASGPGAGYRPAGRRFDDAPPQRPRKRKRRRRPKFGRIFGALALLLVIVLAAVTLWADSRLARVDAMPAQHVANTAGTNWLLVGSDSRAGLSEKEQADLVTGGDSGSQRTDTIMLMHIPNGGQATLVSLPRDSYVNIPGYGQNKINAAYSFGGAPLLIETVEQNTGLKIDHYAEIGFGGFSKLVDAVGDITLCPEAPISDPLIGLELQAGCQKMDGPTALKYVRTRHTPQGDFDRVQRQREFVAAIAKKASSPSTLLNPFKAVPLMTSGLELFEVDKGDHIWHLARLALALAGGSKTETVPNGGTSSNEAGSVVLWDDSTTAYFKSLS